MAMDVCIDCGCKISLTCKTCPKCGRTGDGFLEQVGKKQTVKEKADWKNLERIMKWGVLLGVIAFCLWFAPIAARIFLPQVLLW